jgi:hypothetical protein
MPSEAIRRAIPSAAGRSKDGKWGGIAQISAREKPYRGKRGKTASSRSWKANRCVERETFKEFLPGGSYRLVFLRTPPR